MGDEVDDMVLVTLPADFPCADLLEVAQILERGGVFVPGFIPPEVGLYDPAGYLFASEVEDKSLILLPDRNIVSRLAKATIGGPVDDQQRVAAAVLAFAQCLDISIEPSIAFHELAPTHGNDAVHVELARFRAADSLHPSVWLDVALGRSDRLPPQPIRAVEKKYRNLDKPLHRWRMNYVTMLKLGELELSDIEPQERVLRLFDWMYQDFILAGPAAVFACHYLSPRFPRKRLMKWLRSADRSRALAGIANATWDITYISDFVRRVNESRDDSTQYIFSSLDEGLRRITGALITTHEPVDLAEQLQAWWSPRQAETIAGRFFDYRGRNRDPSWYENQRNRPNAISEFIAVGEASIRAWSPAPSRPPPHRRA